MDNALHQDQGRDMIKGSSHSSVDEVTVSMIGLSLAFFLFVVLASGIDIRELFLLVVPTWGMR